MQDASYRFSYEWCGGSIEVQRGSVGTTGPAIASRVLTPYPEETTIIFSGAHMPSKVAALRARKAEAVMISFQYLRSPSHTRVFDLLNWGARRYLDSGVFTIVRRGIASRIQIAKAKLHEGTKEDLWQEFKALTKAYADYLKRYHQEWDHVAELDVDQVFGPEVTWWARKNLRQIVGDKLLPVWHALAGYSSWAELVRTYPYVAIGSDAAIRSPSSRLPALPRHELRSLVDEAHHQGTLVHGMGDTRYETFLRVGWDSADSTTWISGGRFGRFVGIKYSNRASEFQTPVDASKSRGFEDFLRANGLDPAAVAGKGEHPHKLEASIILLQQRQERVREIRRLHEGL